MSDERDQRDADRDDMLDTELHRMTAVGDADVERSAARVVMRVRGVDDGHRVRRPVVTRPGLAWGTVMACAMLCAIAGGAWWLSTVARSTTSAPMVAPPASSASPVANAASPSQAPALPPAGPAAHAPTVASAHRTISNAPAPAAVRRPSPAQALTHDGSRLLPRVALISVASIEPEPLKAAAPLTTAPVVSEAIEIDPILVDPVSPSAQEPKEP